MSEAILNHVFPWWPEKWSLVNHIRYAELNPIFEPENSDKQSFHKPLILKVTCSVTLEKAPSLFEILIDLTPSCDAHCTHLIWFYLFSYGYNSYRASQTTTHIHKLNPALSTPVGIIFPTTQMISRIFCTKAILGYNAVALHYQLQYNVSTTFICTRKPRTFVYPYWNICFIVMIWNQIYNIFNLMFQIQLWLSLLLEYKFYVHFSILILKWPLTCAWQLLNEYFLSDCLVQILTLHRWTFLYNSLNKNLLPRWYAVIWGVLQLHFVSWHLRAP